MPTIPLSGRPQKDIRVQLGEDNYEKHCSNVEFPEPKGTVVRWRGGTPDAVLADFANTEQVCNITMIQAWDDGDSLCRFMFEHAGERVVLRYKPHADAPFEVESTVTLVAPTIGGAVNQYNESTVACPCTPPLPVTP
jgi:hypothetical protein